MELKMLKLKLSKETINKIYDEQMKKAQSIIESGGTADFNTMFTEAITEALQDPNGRNYTENT
jgi:hypothetical protein